MPTQCTGVNRAGLPSLVAAREGSTRPPLVTTGADAFMLPRSGAGVHRRPGRPPHRRE